MMELLKRQAQAGGYQLRIVPAECLYNLKDEINHFNENEKLNGFQKWIVNELYHFDLPEAEFDIKSIIIAAIPHPFYAKTEFIRESKRYELFSLIMSDFDHVDTSLNSLIIPRGYHIISAPNLPYKRLAVKSGLAVYGRNNICYVDGMGSSLSFAAYFTDILCTDYEWTDIKNADRCANCRACMNNCPTGAIRPDRFLIDNEKCLSCHNEVPGDFPAWLPGTSHHLLYDCLKCQIVCPMNTELINNIAGPFIFSEEETGLLLSGAKIEDFTPELKQKVKVLGMDQWLGAIPRNLSVLFDLYDQSMLKL